MQVIVDAALLLASLRDHVVHAAPDRRDATRFCDDSDKDDKFFTHDAMSTAYLNVSLDDEVYVESVKVWCRGCS